MVIPVHALLIRRLVLLAALICPAVAIAADDQTPLITVSATGTQAAAPDMAILNLTVTREAKTARSALDENNRAMNQVVNAMKAAGVAPRDLQTSGFSISPRMIYPRRNGNNQQPPKIVGYTVSNSLTVRVRELTRVGNLMDQAVTLGVNQGGNVRFTNAKPAEILAKARATAMKNAIAKAKTLVQAAGVGLGRIARINESSRRPGRPRPMAQMRMAESSADSVPIQGGESEYAVTVTVSWEIRQ